MTSSINVPVYSDALVVLGTAGIIVPLVKRWGINPVIGYLAAGALLGPLGLGSFIAAVPVLYWFTVVDAKNVAGIAELGVVFMLFLIGLELSYDRLMAMRRLVFGFGGTQIIVSALLLAAIAAAAGQPLAAAIVIGACLAMSSTAIVLEVLSKEGRLTTSAGRASFAVLLAQDLAVIPVLMFITFLGANGEATLGDTILRTLLQAVLVGTGIVLVGRLLLRPLFRLVASAGSTELFIAAVLFVIVGTGFVAALAGLSMALGAFMAGLMLAETEYRKAIESSIEPFKGLLLGIFFFTVGMGLDMRDVLRDPLGLLVGLAGLIGLKAAIVLAAGRFFRLSWPALIESALLLGPGGEFAFVGIGLAAGVGVVTQQAAGFVFVLITFSMALIPLLATVAHRLTSRLHPHGEPAPELAARPLPAAGHAIVVGYGRVGQVVSSLLRQHGVAHTAIDFDPELVAQERRRGHDVYYGDATRQDFLRACGIMEASGLVITIQVKSVTSEIVAEARRLRPDLLIVARARDAAHARHLYAIGVCEAVPETVEASLQLSEAALLGLGVAKEPVSASIDRAREKSRSELQRAGAGTHASQRNVGENLHSG